MTNTFYFTDFDQKLIKMLQKKYPSLNKGSIVRYALTMCIKDCMGIEVINPIGKAYEPLTPEECTADDLRTISEAGYDLVIEDGILCGWRKKDE